MFGKKTFITNELVLKVKEGSYNPEKYPLQDWDRYLNILCGDRSYQKKAIITSLAYLVSEKYETIESLVEDNYNTNDKLREKYQSLDQYKHCLQLRLKKSGCIEMATGTGKSYVIYGIAQIALGLGIVDKVLVLGPPSTTIERGLTEKFESLANNIKLKEAIPASSYCKSVEVINANKTIERNCICVENINAVYGGTGSSIKDSLAYNGSRCLVLNDEIHHAYNKVSGNSANTQSIKKWKEFLLDNSYNFKYILGFTGTAYINDDYFNDVIYRYSLNQATEDGFIKTIQYVDKDEDENENEKFQKILINHKEVKEIYNDLKPITILITRDIREAKQLKTRLVEFLSKYTDDNKDFISDKKVLIVTSDPEHKDNVLKLPFVDSKDDPTEWIISVAMLTEGWDVKNVFQIVPMEEKAFNSKLLIAQVLGRGLRLPEGHPKAKVIVYNHSRWSNSIKTLVQEVLESETKISNNAIIDGERGKYNFTLYNLTYNKNRTEITRDNQIEKTYKDFIYLESETPNKESETKYIQIGSSQVPFKKTYNISKERFLVSDIIDKIEEAFKAREYERFVLKIGGEEYSNEVLPPRETIENLIRNSMAKVGLYGDYLGKANKVRIMSAFNTLLRKATKTVNISKSPGELKELQTKSKISESLSLSSLKKDSSIFYSYDYENDIIDEETKSIISQIKDDRDFRGNMFQEHSALFKTSVDLVFTHGNPEESFVQKLVEPSNSRSIASWIKSSNQSFYSLDYSIREGSHSTIHSFNPDFFIRIKYKGIDYISVIEIKEDGDDSKVNMQKYKYAKEHFSILNDELEKANIKQRYIFNFLTPQNYAEYFDYIKDGRLMEGKFVSALDLMLDNDINKEDNNEDIAP